MADLSIGDVYDLLTAAIAPRPVAVVTSISSAGTPNLAPFSFLAMGGTNPASLCFSATLNAEGGAKETLRNISEQGEFVVNSVHRKMMAGLAQATIKLPGEADKWARAGLTTVPSDIVRPPRIAESRIQFECKTFQIVEHGIGPGAARYVIGEVLLAHIDKAVLTNGSLDPTRVHPVLRAGGKTYLDLEYLETFE